MSTADRHLNNWPADQLSPNELSIGEVSVEPPLRMTELEFERWATTWDGGRAEWVDGEVQIMSPVTYEHTSLTIWLTHLLSAFLEVRPIGELLGPEFLVRLEAQRRQRIPDLLFVSASRRELIKPTYLDGPPDVAIEIVSDDSQARDWREKYLEYEAAGVREYWIIDPLSRRIEANRLGDDGRFARIAEVDGKYCSGVIGGWYLKNAWLWATSPL